MKAFLKISPVLLPLLFIALFAAIILLKAPLHQAFEYNPDEGIYLAITSLLSRGETTSQERSIIELITKHGDRTRWLITDMTMFGFSEYKDIPVQLYIRKDILKNG